MSNSNLKTFDNFSQEDILLYKKVPSLTETRKLDFLANLASTVHLTWNYFFLKFCLYF